MKKKLAYRLALDLGSTSLGWALFRLDAMQAPSALIKAGVRIFSDGRSPKDGSSLAVTRRAARAMRRRRDRLLKRKARMLDQLVRYGFFPADTAERKALEQLNPFQLRAKGLHEALTPGEFARTLFHINQRRGFQSNRKTDRKDNDSGALKKAINQLREQIATSGCATVGEWFWKTRMEQKPEGVRDQGVRARYRETPFITDEGKKRIDKSYDLYVDRAMIAQEFDALWAAQAALQPCLFTEAARVDLKGTLLFQRPLRPVRPGRCTLEPDEERAPLALPSTQRFRILQEVNHLRLLDDALREVPLTLAQRDAVVAVLEGMRSGRNATEGLLSTGHSLDHWDMRSGRNCPGGAVHRGAPRPLGLPVGRGRGVGVRRGGFAGGAVDVDLLLRRCAAAGRRLRARAAGVARGTAYAGR